MSFWSRLKRQRTTGHTSLDLGPNPPEGPTAIPLSDEGARARVPEDHRRQLIQASRRQIEILENGHDPRALDTAVTALIKIGPEAVPLLMEKLAVCGFGVRRYVVPALAGIGDPSSFAALIDIATNEKESEVRSAAIAGLGKIGDERALDLLIRTGLDKEEHSRVRSTALAALGLIGGDRAREALQSVAADPYVQGTVSEVLAARFGILTTKALNGRLRLAAGEGDIAAVEKLLTDGADPEDSPDYETALNCAARSGHVAIVSLLLSHGAGVEGAFNSPTPLTQAARDGHLEVVKVLMAAGADVNAVSKHSGEHPLHCAAENGHLEIVRALLEGGAAINSTCKIGRSPLYVAVLRGWGEVVKILLDHRANVNQRALDDYTPLGRAVEEGCKDIERLLREHGAAM